MSNRYVKAACFLTPQQRKVLEHMAAGQSHAQIAVALRTSRQTVKKHIVNICDKFFSKDEHFRMFVEFMLLEGYVE